MPEIASLSVGLTANIAPLTSAFAALDAILQQGTASVTAFGTALDKAFSGEAAKQAKLAAAFERTTASIASLETVAVETGGSMTAAFSVQAGQIGAIGAAATGAAASLAEMKAAGGAGSVTAGPVAGPTASAVSSAGVNEATSAFEKFGSTLRSVGSMLSLYITAPLALLGGFAVKAAADFEQAMARIQGTFNLPKQAMSDLSKLAVKLGADITLPNTSAVDAAQALQQLMSSGLSMKDAMAAARPVLQLSAVAMIDNKEAALITAQAMNAYGIAGKDAAVVTDLLVNGMRATGASAQDFAKGLTTVAPAAQLANQSVNDMATGIALLVRAGMTAPQAGTALTTMLLRIANPTEKAKELMDQFHISVRNLDGTMKPLPAIFEEFRNKMGAGVTVTKAFGGEIDEMDKNLKKAEATFKTAQKTMGDLPPVIAQQNARLADLHRQLSNVDEPARKLTATISDEKQKISLLTEEMNRHNTEGLAKMARANVDAKGRIAETSLEIQVQRRHLVELKQQLASMQASDLDAGGNGNSTAIIEKRLEITRLANSIRTNKEDIVDWNKQIVDNNRQMREGLDATKDKKLRIDELSNTLKDNEKKLDDWNKAGKAEKTTDLNVAIGVLNQQLVDNKAKLLDATKAQAALSEARQNAQRITVKMTQEDRDKVVGDIFGQRGFKPIEIAMKFNPSGYEALKKQITEVGTTNRVAIAIQDTLNGKMDGLRSAADNLALTFGNKFSPAIKGAVDWLTKLTEGLNKMAPAQVQMVTSFAAIAASIGPVLLGVGLVVKALTFFTGPIGWVVAAVGALALAWATNFGDIQGKTAAFVAWVKPFLLQAWNAVKGDFMEAGKAIQAFAKDLWPQIQQLMQQFAVFWKAHHVEIVAALSGAWTLIKGIVQTGWALISGIIKIGLDILRGDWGKAWKDLGALAKGYWDGQVNMVKGAGALLIKGIEFVSNAIIDEFQQMFKSVGNIFKGWGTSLVQFGRDIVQGLINGMQGMIGAVATVTAAIGQTVISTLRSALGIHSPSTVMQEAGQNIGQGLVNGIKSGEGQVKAAMSSLIPANMQLGPGGGSGQDKNGNVEGQADWRDSGSKITPLLEHPFGTSYQSGQAISQFSGVLDTAYKKVGNIISNADAKLMEANLLFANQVVNAAKAMDKQQNIALGFNAGKLDTDILAQGMYENLRKQAASGQYSSITVGGKTINRDNPGKTPNVTINQTINGGINNEADEKRLTARIVDVTARSLRFGT